MDCGFFVSQESVPHFPVIQNHLEKAVYGSFKGAVVQCESAVDGLLLWIFA